MERLNNGIIYHGHVMVRVIARFIDMAINQVADKGFETWRIN